MLAPRSLADRLDAVRLRASTAAPARPAADERVEALARWFDARADVAEDGTALVIERSVPISPAAAKAVGERPAAAYFDTETTGLSTGAGTVIFMAAVARLDRGRVTVRQYLLPDYPYERPLLRAVAADLASFPRLVTYK